ncbi:MAG: HIT domain-containing protein [Deltaproteobacteria bacterium]|nr:HIT domain-containing protein [Deltaproteobacteria bacterium]
MENCIFCKIARREIPANIVYESENVLAFDDVNPTAPVHVVAVPKIHVATLMDVSEDVMEDMMKAVQEVARIKGIDKTGFRTVINCNEDGGQSDDMG